MLHEGNLCAGGASGAAVFVTALPANYIAASILPLLSWLLLMTECGRPTRVGPPELLEHIWP